MLLNEIKNIQSDSRQLRNFGLSVGGVLLIIGIFLYWNANPNAAYLLGGGAALVLLGLIIPVLLLPIQKIWMTFAVIMGWVMTRVILALLYYIVLTLIGFIARMTGKQFLELKWDRSQHTYWNYRENQDFDRKIYEKQF